MGEVVKQRLHAGHSLGLMCTPRFKFHWTRVSDLPLFSANCIKELADIPSYSLTLSIGLPNIWVLRFARVGHTHIKWSVDSSSMPQAAHVYSIGRALLARPITTPSFVVGKFLKNLASFKHSRFIQTLDCLHPLTKFQ
jgi:hypothetical protein